MFVTLTSPDARYDSLFLANYATIRLKDELARLPGVGNVSVFGAGQYSMRIWLDPEGSRPGVSSRRTSSSRCSSRASRSPPVRSVCRRRKVLSHFNTLNLAGRLDDVEQFENVIVKTGDKGEITRVRDVGSVELGAQTYGQIFTLNGKPAAGMAIFQSPGANALDVAGTVKDRMTLLEKDFPPGMVAAVPFDTTVFVSQSIEEVYKTLIEAGLLVLVVILLFLQDWRATLVPATTVPVTIIGAFAAMAALGFTVNLATLLQSCCRSALLSTMRSSCGRRGASHGKGLSAHDAAIQAMNELFAPIIGITLVLVAVFLPASFLPGLTGRMYAQFALVIAATALLSAINAATLPTQSASWLRPPVPPEQRNFFIEASTQSMIGSKPDMPD